MGIIPESVSVFFIQGIEYVVTYYHQFQFSLSGQSHAPFCCSVEQSIGRWGVGYQIFIRIEVRLFGYVDTL